MICFNKLFSYMALNGIKRTELYNCINRNTIYKLSRNEVVKTDTLDKICTHLGCKVEDIVEFKS